MKAYKGFNTDMTCRGFQYEEGKEYETDTAEVGRSGFHACGYPLECMEHYRPNASVYHEVEVGGDIDKKENETIVCATKIKIGRQLTTAEMVAAAIEYTESKAKEEAESDEDYGASSATGYYGASVTTGYKGSAEAGNATAVAVAWGRESAAKGCVGAHLVLADWRWDDVQGAWILSGAKLVQVDGETIKPDTLYRYNNGEVVEVTA